MVFYRKYRPQSLDEIVGQAQVKETLASAFKESKLAHAYLFCGPRGTGKTSTARILAKMVNCELARSREPGAMSNPKNSQASQLKPHSSSLTAQASSPCNQCSSCMSITDGSNLDLIEIDAASNRGIDDIRTLRENIKLSPTSSRKKVYIIDEVHMLSNEAFNALLKTLEEPPEHVLFILATTEAHKIPITILSRVQKLDFKLASVKDVMIALKRIVEAEKIDIDEEALRSIAKSSEGSFRDGEKLLDQLSSMGGKISLEMVDQIQNSGSFNQLLEMTGLILSQNSKEALLKVSDLNELGVNIKEYVNALLEVFRYLFLIKNQAGEGILEDLGPARFEKLTKLSDQSSQSQLLSIIKLLQESLEKIKTTSLPILALEVAVVEACQVRMSDVRSQTSDKKNNTPENVIAGVSEAISPAAAAEETQTSSPTVILSVSEESIDPSDVSQDDNSQPDLPAQSPQLTAHDSLAALQDKWNYILETVKSKNFSLGTLLQSAKLASCEEDLAFLEVPYAFHQRIIESQKNRELLESVLSDVLTHSVHVQTILGARPVATDDVANVEVAADDEIIRVAAEIFSSDSTQLSDSPTN